MHPFARLQFVLVLAGLLAHLTLFNSLAQEVKEKTEPNPKTDSEEKPKADEPRKFKRLDESTDEDLRKQLLLVPELGFDQAGAAYLYATIRKVPAKSTASIPPDIGTRFYGQLALQYKKPEMTSLPWRTGLDCQLGKESAERLQVLSINLRGFMRASVPANDIRPDTDKLRTSLTGGNLRGTEKPLEWSTLAALPTLMQMLQSENTATRMLMIEMLSKIEGKDASVALAQRAVFDLSPQVRERAVESLTHRPRKEFQHVFLESLRWPWPQAAQHAAEAITMLRMKETLPELIHLLKEPDPRLPYTMTVTTTTAKEKKEEKIKVVREVVRLNHMSNCALCHALSTSKEDLVRGRIPVPGEEMPPLYYAATTGLFVRADTTFLRQDFSVVQPVSASGKWPGYQRYDYLLRTRKATTEETKLLAGLEKQKKLGDPYPQREAILFTLRELTGSDLGSRTESWLPLLGPADKQGAAPTGTSTDKK